MENILHRTEAFRIPGNFAEFYTQYPTYIHNFVRRYMKWRPIQEQQDRESELINFLLTLPAQSKFRHPGANGIPGGCTDPIMAFNPERSYGNSAGHFFGYLNRILRNQFLSLEARTQLNPVTRLGTLRIVDSELTPNAEAAHNKITEERALVLYQQLSPRLSESPTAYKIVSRFLDFVSKHNRELIPVLESITSCTTYLEAQADLGLDSRFFNRARLRLKVLYTCFATGKPVPRQRRVYRSRSLAPITIGGMTRKVSRISNLQFHM
jgi:hypothetical protein